MIDPRVGYVRDSFAAMAMVLDLMATTGEPLSRLVADLPRYAMIKDQYPLAQNFDTRAEFINRRAWRRVPMGPNSSGLPRRQGRSARWSAARLGRPLGARSRQ